LHWKATGVWPRLHPPRTLNEKLCWRKAYLWRDARARDLLARTADKVECRDYVAKKVGSQYLTRDFHWAADSRDLPFNELPNRFVVKASHGSTWCHFVQDKDREDIEALHQKCDRWLATTWGEFAGEWWYALSSRKILAEEYLDDGSGGPPRDFKIFVMRGKVAMIQLDFDRHIEHKRNLYDPQWRQLPTMLAHDCGPPCSRPANLDEMLTIAGRLGEEFDFVRVDMYLIGSRIVVGELTHCPGSGWEKFSNPEIDLWLGEQIRLPIDG
jgi:hypothetical protein